MADIEETQSKGRGLLDILPDTFSRRKRAQAAAADPLFYDSMPDRIRMQVLHIFDESISLDSHTKPHSQSESYGHLTSFMRMELGVARLGSGYDIDEFRNWFMAHERLDDVLDALEMIFRIIAFHAERSVYGIKKAEIEVLIEQLNGRLLEGGVGFQFESGRLIQANSRYLHAEVVVPALHLLSDPKFAAANKEFLDAHEAFREGDYEKTLVECCKAFESVIKVIAADRGWGVAPNATAKAAA